MNKEMQFEQRFAGYRKPNEATIPKYQKIQEATYVLARLIQDECPESLEKSKALTDLQNVRMWANASVAIHTPEPVKFSEEIVAKEQSERVD